MAQVSQANSILISRADSIGDVVLTLPMAGVLKQILPGVKIIFLGKNYIGNLRTLFGPYNKVRNIFFSKVQNKGNDKPL